MKTNKSQTQRPRFQCLLGIPGEPGKLSASVLDADVTILTTYSVYCETQIKQDVRMGWRTSENPTSVKFYIYNVLNTISFCHDNNIFTITGTRGKFTSKFAIFFVNSGEREAESQEGRRDA